MAEPGAEAPPAPPTTAAAEDVGAQRFEVELEFVQCLASPEYLHFLAQQRYFDDPAFMAFLQYLTYWRRPQYAKYLMYPHCLAMLDALLNSKRFRSELLMESFRDFVHQQQFFHWQHKRRDPLVDALREADKQLTGTLPEKPN
ncbi:SOH1-domain-containing protein [Tribonema minus]|uniref:Mediator of RNA polymerase II transcription subunit 31 n=1 Tax=Tribonema minus TaxID=303371 RepID=A0A835Z5G5_9STRA|nr:SOH1-domain-containing protein [Tribonema minus]